MVAASKLLAYDCRIVDLGIASFSDTSELLATRLTLYDSH
jgi:hypothetical protein